MDYSSLEAGKVIEGHRTFKVTEVTEVIGNQRMGGLALIKVGK